jgi:microsomal dipeptidase-like Zn-dependent dipeptidase
MRCLPKNWTWTEGLVSKEFQPSLTVSDLHKLDNALSGVRFSDNEVDKVMQKNWMRILERAFLNRLRQIK